MLSVLIPVYNYDVRQFIYALHQQLVSSGVPFEMILADDASDFRFREQYQELSFLSHISILQLSKNTGRQAIRFEMARRARYPSLLFLDCDASVTHDRFIQQYLDVLKKDGVIVGGRVYADAKPAVKNLRLHWHYGKQREQIPAAARNRNPYASFMTNNFIIPQTIWQNIPIVPLRNGYGHEDTVVGWYLSNHKIPVMHIDNSLRHEGLVDDRIFFQHANEAVGNLADLYIHHPQYKNFLEQKVRLVSRAGFAKYVPGFLMAFFYRLTLKTHSLFCFDLYRLLLFKKQCRELQQEASRSTPT